MPLAARDRYINQSQQGVPIKENYTLRDLHFEYVHVMNMELPRNISGFTVHASGIYEGNTRALDFYADFCFRCWSVFNLDSRQIQLNYRIC